MRNHNQRRHTPPDTAQGLFQALRVQGRKALVQHQQARLLQQGTRHKEPTALAVGKLPAALAHLLHQTAGHTIQQIAQPQFDADILSRLHILGQGRPGAQAVSG